MGGQDNPICVAGTFNKLVEKLEGIHPDVIVKYITPQLAGMKLRMVVIEEVQRYLIDSTNPKTAGEFAGITSQLVLMQKEGLSAIWWAIKDKVSARMFDEFGSLYSSDRDRAFTDLIDTGLCVDLAESSSFQKELSASEGYEKYCKAALFYGNSPRMASHDVFFKRLASEGVLEDTPVLGATV